MRRYNLYDIFVIEDDGTLFLKTLYLSRKATKKYLKGK